MHASSPPNAFTFTPPSSTFFQQPPSSTTPTINNNCMDSPPLALSSPSESLGFRQSLQLDVDTTQSTTTATKPESLESQLPPEALAQLTMSSSSTPAKRSASGGDTGDQKASDRNKVESDDFDDFLSGLNDEVEDTNDVEAADEKVVETTETSTEGPEQTPELDAKLMKVIKEVRDLEDEIDRKKKETEELRAKTKVITSVTKTWVKYMDMAEKIVREHGGESSEKETRHLKNIKHNLIVLTREMDDPFFTSLMQQALPDKVVPGLRPFRSRTEDQYNEDEPPDGGKADDEDGSISSSEHEDSEAAIEPEKERGHEFERAQEPDHRASASDPGNEHQDALFAYIERQRHKLSKSAREGHGPRARAERH
ncbi:hypothetical protein KC323_g7428 [Hortaea werneckii]|nr:hypothetical protein KC323_g7428 [Hortaea werneckii]